MPPRTAPNRRTRRDLARDLASGDDQAIARVAQLDRPVRIEILRDAIHRPRWFGSDTLPVAATEAVRSSISGTIRPSMHLRSLQWHVDLLLLNAAPLRTFLAHRSTFTRRLLVGDYLQAGHHLDEVEKKFGRSVWLLQCRATLHVLSTGLADALASTHQPRPVLDQWIYQRFALAASPELPSQPQLDELKTHLAPIEDPLRSFLRLLVLGRTDSTLNSNELWEDLLYFAWMLSPPDRLLLLTHLFQMLITEGVTTELDDSIPALIAADLLSPNVGVVHSGVMTPSALDRRATNIANAYTEGRYASAANDAANLLHEDPSNLSAVQLLVASCARAGVPPQTLLRFSPGSPVGRIVNVAWNAGQPSRSQDRGVTFRQLSVALAPTVLGLQLLAAAERASFDPMTSDHARLLRAVSKSALTPLDCLVSRPTYDSPSMLRQLPLAELCEPSAALLRYSDGGDIDRLAMANIPKYRIRKYSAMRAMHIDGRSAAALQLRRALEDPSFPALDKPDCVRLLWGLTAHEPGSGFPVDLLAWCSIYEPEFVTPDRLELAYLTAGRRPPQERANPYSWALLCAGRMQIRDTEESRARLQHAFEDVLRNSGCGRPSELTAPDLDSATGLGSCFVAFMRSVCIPDVMDSCILDFAVDPRGVQKERIAVLQRLRELDDASAQEYVLEITERTRSLALTEALRGVQQSKLAIDVRTLESLALRSLSDYVATFMVFRVLGATLPPGLAQKLVIHTGDRQFELMLTGSVPRATFRDLFDRALAIYTRDPNHGLDRYLGLRVRHGFFAGAARAPFEIANLVSGRSNDGVYLPNVAWDDALPPAASSAIYATFAEFSRSIDSVIDRVRSRLLQVRDAAHPDGLFDYSFSNAEQEEQFAVANDEAADAEDIVHAIYSAIDARTLTNLDRVRQMLRDEVKAEFVRGLDDLLLACGALGVDHVLANAIAQARLDCGRAISIIESWFSQAGSVVYDDYRLSLLFQAAVAITSAQYPRQPAPVVGTLRADPLFKARTLGHMLDALTIVLSNAMRYCTAGTVPQLEARPAPLGAVTIVVTNEVPADAEVFSRIAELNSRLQGGNPETESLDRGSGLAKLYRLLNADVGTPAADSRIEVSNLTVGVFLHIGREVMAGEA